MQRHRLIAFCVLLMLSVAGSGFVFSQSVDDAYKTFVESYQDEFFQSQDQQQKWNEYNDFAWPRKSETLKNLTDHLRELNSSDNTLTEDERAKHLSDFIFDQYFAEHKALNDKTRELFPAAQKIQQRQFQLYESMMRRLQSTDNSEDIYDVFSQTCMPSSLPNPQPDFLELTPEQIALIKEIQKETAFKSSHLHPFAFGYPPEYSELMKKLGEAKTSEEIKEIRRMMKEMEVERMKENAPEMKAILIQGRESYMRVLTDAQKAKIKAVMDDMPDYMKNLFAAIDKQGGGLSILHNWQPGMGVPDYPNPNREAPRQRTTGGGGRAFPGD